MQSLRAQGKEEQAVMIEKRFKKAWNQADVTLTASRFMGEAGPRWQVREQQGPAIS